MKPFKIAIVGLPGSGKTSLAMSLYSAMSALYSVKWYNADNIRKITNNWDFSESGRIKQATTLAQLADVAKEDIVLIDFVCALHKQAIILDADFTIWMDTIKAGRFDDTNNIYSPPVNPDLTIKDFRYDIITIITCIEKKLPYLKL